ncbi:MAG: hypothetical protein SFU99_00610 [Saprospiraceae bacterium]|nr:hypothetical protein [Saprospiraceae bacterium]
MELYVALIGAIAIIVAPIITLIIQEWIQNRKYPSVGNRRDISGIWKGSTVQGNSRSVNISGILKAKTKKISGDAVVEWENSSMKLKFKGHFLDENHIHINYESDDKTIKNFGSQILKISSNGSKLEGLTIGYGSEAESIISGTTILNRLSK